MDTTGSGLDLEALAKDIRARISAGDKAARKSEEHYKSAGIHLIEAKARVAEIEMESGHTISWEKWCASHFPQTGERRIQQLLAIGRGDTTQAEINEAERNRYAEMSSQMRDVIRRADAALKPESESTPTSDDAQVCSSLTQTPRQAANAASQSRRRADARAARVAAGADLPPPLAPIEHRRLLKQGRDLLGALSFDDLRMAVERVKVVPSAAQAEAVKRVAAAEAALEALATRSHTPEELFAAIVPTLNAWSDVDLREFSTTVTDYIIDQPIKRRWQSHITYPAAA
jgi:hypothetical protein